MNILIIDDEIIVLKGEDRIIRNCIAREFPNEPIEIDFCQRASQAIKTVQEKNYSIIFLDIEMPKMKGIALAHELEKWAPEANLFFVSGYNEYKLVAWGTYCCGYLMKPLTEQQVFTALQRLRYPLKTEQHEKLTVKCIGSFELSYKGKDICFSRKKSMEMMAVLVDQFGADTSIEKIRVFLWEEKEDTYKKMLM